MKCLFLSFLLTPAAFACTGKTSWETVATEGEPVARHEAAFVEFDGLFYLMGGRRIEPVSIYNPATNTWRNASKPPLEFHHFQPVVVEDTIWMMGAMTGGFPHETGLEHILIYHPETDRWQEGPAMPADRIRGGAGAVLVDNAIYLIGGIVRGHQGGYVSWADKYDLSTETWSRLPDAPHARDHFQAAYLDGKIYAAGGRQTSRETGETFSRVIPAVDVFDLKTQTWSSLPEDLPTPRAGNSTAAMGRNIVVAGGESHTQHTAHREVEAWHVDHAHWACLPPLNEGRHGTGLILHEQYIYTCSGSGNRGGSPELTTMERLKIEAD